MFEHLLGKLELIKTFFNFTNSGVRNQSSILATNFYYNISKVSQTFLSSAKGMPTMLAT
jgi:hypothetical protein